MLEFFEFLLGTMPVFIVFCVAGWLLYATYEDLYYDESVDERSGE